MSILPNRLYVPRRRPNMILVPREPLTRYRGTKRLWPGGCLKRPRKFTEWLREETRNDVPQLPESAVRGVE